VAYQEANSDGMPFVTTQFSPFLIIFVVLLGYVGWAAGNLYVKRRLILPELND
jgi:hypothetical protein